MIGGCEHDAAKPLKGFGSAGILEVVESDSDGTYRAVYTVKGIRIVGFDNERGKGDHCHLDGEETAYRFTTVEQLVEDFIAAVAARRA
jgi:hypothetical protein